MAMIRRLRRAFWFGATVLAVTVAAVLYFSDANWRHYGEGRGLDEPVDAVLVLGGGMDPDAVPGYSSRRRVDAALALLGTGATGKLIFLGGPIGPAPSPSGGTLMRDYALSRGAPAEALLAETRSRTTFENLRFGFAIARQHDWHRLAILTDAFHLERARRLAAYFGHPQIGLVAAPGLALENPVDRSWSILREALAWWYNLVKVGAWELMDLAGVSVETRGELIR